jgi:AhpD family alkylhydroperoxidase
MKARLIFKKFSPKGMQALGELSRVLRECGLDHALLELVKLRASQINGCAHCIDMHTKELRADGESEQRVYLLSAWEESPFYSDRERAALAWTEAVTLITDGHVPDSVYELAHSQFSEEELVNLTLAIVAINGANRLNIAFRTIPGNHRAAVRPTTEQATVAHKKTD